MSWLAKLALQLAVHTGSSEDMWAVINTASKLQTGS